jgi:hypothetical protein
LPKPSHRSKSAFTKAQPRHNQSHHFCTTTRSHYLTNSSPSTRELSPSPIMLTHHGKPLQSTLTIHSQTRAQLTAANPSPSKPRRRRRRSCLPLHLHCPATPTHPVPLLSSSTPSLPCRCQVPKP